MGRHRPIVLRPATGGGGSLADLAASDLTFLGQIDTNPGTYLRSHVMAMRSVGGELRFLVPAYSDAALATFTATISGTTMTVSAVSGGTLAVGQYIGRGTLDVPQYITGLGTGSGGIGTYIVTNSQSISSPTAMATYYDAGCSEWVGDLVEYAVTGSLKNGGSHWDLSNVPQGFTERRRWKKWTTFARMQSSRVSFTGSISGTTLTVSSPSSNTIVVGMSINDASGSLNGISGVAQTITAFGSGTGGAGTYTVSASQSAGSQSMSANYPNAFKHSGQAGIEIGGMYWDETYSRAWYGTGPQYNSNVVWPAWNAVTLDDADAVVVGDSGTNSNVTSTGNIHGPYYFKDNTTADLFKDAYSGMFAIDSSCTAAMGGTHILSGHHAANIGDRGARSIGLWVIPSLPSGAAGSMPAAASVLWSSAYHLYDTSWSSGKTQPNVHKPNFAKNGAYHGGNANMARFVTAAGTPSALPGSSAGTTVNDKIYVQESPYSALGIDTVAVFMDTGASGGTWAPEIYNGSAWVEPTSWACSTGDAALSAAENVFYWPKQSYSYDASTDWSFGGEPWVRLRRKTAGVSGGTVKFALATISMVNWTTGDDEIPLPSPSGYVGSYVRPGSGTALYDSTHYGFQMVEFMYGGQWVKTSNVEGLVYVGALGSGGHFYGPMPSYAQDEHGNVPVKYESANLPGVEGEFDGIGVFSNGPRYEGPYQPHLMPFTVSDLLAAAGDSTKRFSTFLNPASYTEMYGNYAGLVSAYTVTNPRITGEPYYGWNRCMQYFSGSTTFFDPATNQLIVQIPSWGQKNILAFFQVR